MALFFDEQQVTDLLTMEMTMAAVEEALKQQGLGTATNNPRTRVRLPTGQLHMMGAALPSHGVIGYKAYTAFRGKARFHVMLYSTDTGELLAMLQADRLGQMRTGAASGVATKYMARPEARGVGIFGTGWQARSQLEAVCAVRRIQTIKAFGRDATRRQTFCAEMTQQLGIPVEAADTPEAVVKGMDVVITSTNAREPLFDGNWLRAGSPCECHRLKRADSAGDRRHHRAAQRPDRGRFERAGAARVRRFVGATGARLDSLGAGA